MYNRSCVRRSASHWLALCGTSQHLVPGQLGSTSTTGGSQMRCRALTLYFDHIFFSDICVNHCREARHHGRQHVGLPSRICSFSQRRNGDERASQDWWDQPRASELPCWRLTVAVCSTHDAVCKLIPAIAMFHAAKTGKDGRASNPAAALSMEAAEPISLTNDEKRLSWRPWGRSRRDEGFSGPLCFFSGFPSGTDTA